jgi:hypothetical protein
MDTWAQDAVDLVGPGFLEFDRDGNGRFGFIAVTGWMDCRHGAHEGRPRVEFSWDGSDEGDHISGRGWAELLPDGSLNGHLFIHNGDDSGFTAVPFPGEDKPRARTSAGRRRVGQ